MNFVTNFYRAGCGGWACWPILLVEAIAWQRMLLVCRVLPTVAVKGCLSGLLRAQKKPRKRGCGLAWANQGPAISDSALARSRLNHARHASAAVSG